jgi:SET family sugar efflux transporter-like MFS transporter
MTHAISDMSAAERRPAQLILISLFVCSLGNSSIIPFMSYFIVDQLGMKPWHISLYSVITSIFIMIGNRLFGEMVDRSKPIFPLVFGASLGLVVASGVLCVVQSYWLLLVVVGPGIALASTGISTMFSLGRLYGEHFGLDLTRYNARVRMMTSLGWMFGPAASYLIAAHFGTLAVFKFVFILSLVGSATSFFTVPHDFCGPRRHIALREDGSREGWFDNKPLWLAAFVCFLFNIAHVLCSAALPLFYTEEAHLPVYAPGLSLTLKCTGEVIAILASPMIMARIGRRNALYLSTGCGLIAFAVLHETNSLAHMVVGALLEGLYFGLFAGVAVTFIQGFAKGRVGRATSLYMNSLFLGSLAANTGIGIIASLVDFRAAIAVAGGAMVLAAAALFATRHADANADA